MASLSEEMKSKRDVKRKSDILIVDNDLGNFGLYKAILASEYVLECAYNVDMAKSLSGTRRFDVIIFDGDLDTEKIKELCDEQKRIYGEQMPEMLVMEVAESKEKIIKYLCMGIKGYITKPFSKEGMTNAIYQVLQERRKKETRYAITLIGEDFADLKSMKKMLDKRYSVNIINDRDVARDYVTKKKANLTIMDVSVMGGEQCICETMMSANDADSRILFTAEAPSGEIIARCSSFNPEGILVKPIDEIVLQQTVENILLRQSYVNDFGKR